MSRILFPLVIGAGGLAILLYLGTWQLQRLGWKQDLLAGIEARISDDPVALPATPDSETDRYLPVRVTGQFGEPRVVRMLASRRTTGAVYRVILPFETEAAGAIMVDVGWVPTDSAWPPRPITQGDLPAGLLELVGNLDWPREADGFTPEPDPAQGLWYARDVPSMAEHLDTRPVLLVLREMPQTDLQTTPWPVDTAGIPNDHLQYAITWFSLAVVWVGMTALFILRTRRKVTES